MPFAKALFPQMKSLLCVPLWVTPMLIPRNIGLFYVLLWFTVESLPMVWKNQVHSPLYWPTSFPWGTLPLLWFYSRFLKPVKVAVTTSSLSGTLCWQLCLFFKGSQGQISLLSSAGWTVQSWLHRDRELVSWRPLLMAYYAFFCIRPSYWIRICFKPGWDLFHAKQESSNYCCPLLVKHFYWWGCTFAQR